MLDQIAGVADIPRLQARERPGAEALWFEGAGFTFGELDRLSNRLANALIARGLKPGERISCLGRNNAEFFMLWLGAVKARVTLAPINWRLAPPEMAFILRDAGSRLLVVGHDFADVVDIIVSDLPDLHGLVQFEAGHERWPGFHDWIAAYPDTDPNLAAEPDDDVIQLYTSGTTGLPKGVQLTEANALAALRSGVEGRWADYEAGKTYLAVMPLFHVAGCMLSLMGLVAGARVAITREVDTAEIIRLIGELKVAYAFMAPTVINRLLHTPGAAQGDYSSLERIIYGASPIAAEVLVQARALTGAGFTQLYGLTETTGGGTILTPADHDAGHLRACGKPGPGYEFRVVLEDGRLAAPRDVGEIQIRSGAVMKGYWARPQATREAIDAEGWFRSGDAGFFCEQGFLHIHDRVKDMILTGGENVYPAEVENALFGHPAVADACVIGVPDDQWGEAVKAIVVLKAGAKADPEALIAHCRGSIAGFKTPKSVEFTDVLPRNPSGKLLRRELRKPYWQGRERQVG
jgi:acyl-CoA synthetase (AMP-forming)/AMP-acid ligase II